MKEVKIVLGFAFGDEGKGVTTQWLCQKALEEGKKPLVVRFSGGPQAAHTVNYGGTEHICSSFGSGVLLGVPTFLDNGVFVDPVAMQRERESLSNKGIEGMVRVSPLCKFITPYDVQANKDSEKIRRDGTCGMGIYTTLVRYASSMNLQGESPEESLTSARLFWGMQRDTELEAQFIEAMKALDTDDVNLKNFDVLIFEGSQGLLLDMDCGFYPHVTPSKTGLNGIASIYLKNAEVYLVTRTYTTRHGNGYKPQYEIGFGLEGVHETNINNEFQGNFLTGALETTLLNRAIERHRLDNYRAMHGCRYNLVITHVDVNTQAGYFAMERNGKIAIRMAGDIKPDQMCEFIFPALNLSFDHVYYNDSIESNIKEYDTETI